MKLIINQAPCFWANYSFAALANLAGGGQQACDGRPQIRFALWPQETVDDGATLVNQGDAGMAAHTILALQAEDSRFGGIQLIDIELPGKFLV